MSLLPWPFDRDLPFTFLQHHTDGTCQIWKAPNSRVGSDPVLKYALPTPTFENAQLHAVPTSTGHEVLGVVGHENIVPSATDSVTGPGTLLRWRLATGSLKDSPYFALWETTWSKIKNYSRSCNLSIRRCRCAFADCKVPLWKHHQLIPTSWERASWKAYRVGWSCIGLFRQIMGLGCLLGNNWRDDLVSQKLRKALVEKLLGMVRSESPLIVM